MVYYVIYITYYLRFKYFYLDFESIFSHKSDFFPIYYSRKCIIKIPFLRNMLLYVPKNYSVHPKNTQLKKSFFLMKYLIIYSQ